jgi:hypothetical protein
LGLYFCFLKRNVKAFLFLHQTFSFLSFSIHKWLMLSMNCGPRIYNPGKCGPSPLEG